MNPRIAWIACSPRMIQPWPEHLAARMRMEDRSPGPGQSGDDVSHTHTHMRRGQRERPSADAPTCTRAQRASGCGPRSVTGEERRRPRRARPPWLQFPDSRMAPLVSDLAVYEAGGETSTEYLVTRPRSLARS